MQHSITTGQRVFAIAAGCVFCAGTLGILFEDVVRGAPLALKHGLTLVILAGTIMTGHLASGARAQGHYFTALGFTLVFLAGTALVVYSSVGRQAETSIQTIGQIEDANERRADIKRDRAKAQEMLAQAYFAFARECSTGKGKKCSGIETTIGVYTAAIQGHDAQIDKIGTPKPVAPEAEQFAEIAAVVFGADKAKVKAAALLVVPFLVTLFLEFGLVVSLGYGFRSTRPSPKALPAVVVPDVVASDPRGGIAVATKAEALEDLLILLKRGTPIESQDVLADRYGVSKSAISKWLAEWEAEGLLTRMRDGKQKMIQAA